MHGVSEPLLTAGMRPHAVQHACCPAHDPRHVAQEHRTDPHRSRLHRLVPSIGRIFTDLPLLRAFQEYDRHFNISRRRFVPPNFAEIRHILNIAQVRPAQILQLDAMQKRAQSSQCA
jgi:IMP-specific 5'-nucleotidase